MSLPQFNFSAIKDPATRDNFEVLLGFLRNQSPLLGFAHFELPFDKAVTNYRFKHGLKFTPKDIIPTSLVGSGVVTYNYEKFTADELDITVSGACTIRFFAGSYNFRP